MRFDFKKTTRAIKRLKEAAERYRNLKFYWHKSFALIPRYVGDGGWAWLEYIERKAILRRPYTSETVWLYRPIYSQSD